MVSKRILHKLLEEKYKEYPHFKKFSDKKFMYKDGNRTVFIKHGKVGRFLREIW